jgi:hypothetical protein
MSGKGKLVSDERTRLFDWRTAVVEADLPPTTKLVALVLSLHMNRAGESCFPGLALLQRQTSLSRSAVQEHVRALALSNWLERRQQPGRGYATEYVATFPPPLVQEIIEKARPAGVSQTKAPVKGPQNAHKRHARAEAPSLEDGRTGGREDVGTSTNVLGAAPRVENARDDMTDGELMGLVRKRLYIPDGRPPAGENGARCVTVIRDLRKQGRSGYDIAAAIEGLALLRDRGDLDWLPPRTKSTMRALLNTRTGRALDGLTKTARPLIALAQETYYKHSARRRDHEPSTGPTLIGDFLREMQ